MAKVSIIIPTYNSEKTILRCLDSVFKQTYQDFELIICDDKSTDNTREILNTISDNRLKVYYLSENSGSAVARNIAMQNAKGDFFAFLDSDDEWYPEKLEVQIPFFYDDNIGLIFSGAKIIKNGTQTLYYKPKKEWEKDSFRKLFLGEINYMTPTAIFRKECLAKIGLMEPKLRRNQDYDFYLRILKNYKLRILEEPLAIVNANTKKITFSQLENSITFYETERIIFFKENFTQKEIDLFFARKYRDLCGAMLRSGQFIKCVSQFKKSLKYSPVYFLWPKNIKIILKSLFIGVYRNITK